MDLKFWTTQTKAKDKCVLAKDRLVGAKCVGSRPNPGTCLQHVTYGPAQVSTSSMSVSANVKYKIEFTRVIRALAIYRQSYE